MAIRRGKATEADKTIITRQIEYTLEMDDFKDCDLVIEAVTENMELKKKIFSELDKVCKEDTTWQPIPPAFPSLI